MHHAIALTLNLAHKHLIFVGIPQTSITKCSYREPTEKLSSFSGSNGPNRPYRYL